MQYPVRTIITALIYLLQYSFNSYAQNRPVVDSMYKFDFVRGDKVIFEDNFDNDDAGSFPIKWKQRCSDCQCQIAIEDDRQVFAFSTGKDVFAEPKIPMQPKADVYVTFECDYKLIDTSKANFKILFSSRSSNDTLGLNIDYYWLSMGWVNKNGLSKTHTDCWGPNHSYFERRHFDPKVWHHFGISFSKKEISLYMDHYRMGCRAPSHTTSGKEVFVPGFIADDFSIAGITPYIIKNVRFAESDHIPALIPINFSSILTSKKFVTHAINFDVNKSIIKEESIDIIHQLAAWLNENPGIKLEIDGHTDNDGTAADNLKLSQERAEAVKAKLILSGISADRLTTKGYGTTKPLKPNTTPEGKAENRRVEFLKK